MVLSVAELDPGIVDDEVLRFSRELKAVLITSDKDFGELVSRQGRDYSGVLLLRLDSLSSERRIEWVVRAVLLHGAALPGSFAVLSPGAFRIRQKVE